MATTQTIPKAVTAESTETQLLVTLASESVSIESFDSPAGQGFDEWRAATDVVLDTLQRVV